MSLICALLPRTIMKVGRRHGSSCSQLVVGFLLCVLAGYLFAGVWQQQQLLPVEQDTTSALLQQPSLRLGKEGGDGGSFDEPDTYEPIIKTPPNLTLSGRRPSRPRFYSTELGTRRKLYVAVLTSLQRVAEQARGFNHTLASIVPDIGFFLLGQPPAEHVQTLKEVVTFPEHQNVNLPLAMADYVLKHYGDLYDYYFFVKDTTYVRGHKLVDLANSLSVSVETFLSAAQRGPQQQQRDPQQKEEEEVSKYCGIESGMLVSRLLLNSISGHSSECMLMASSGDNLAESDVPLVRCLERFSDQACSHTAQDHVFVSRSLRDISADQHQQQMMMMEDQVLTVRDVISRDQFRQLHVTAGQSELAQLSARIQRLRQAVLANRRNLRALLATTSSGSGGDQPSGSAASAAAAAPAAPPSASSTGGLGELVADEPVWPLGSPSPVRTASRHHLNLWQRFTRHHIYLPTPDVVVRLLTANERLDVEDVIGLAMEELRRSSGRQYQLVELQSAHKRFDGGRGMDYVVDMIVTTSDLPLNTSIKRVEIHRPIMKAELVPMPFVTEKPTVSVVVPVLINQVQRAQEFVDTVMSNNENLAIVLVLISADSSLEPFRPLIQTVRSFNNRTAGPTTGSGGAGSSGSRMGWVTVTGAGNHVPSQFFLMDLASRKLSDRALVLLFSSPAIEYVSEMFNRVRMQTIRGWEVFAPIPWVEHHPDLIYNDGVRSSQQLTVHKQFGLFDADMYGIISFYMSDYKNMRKAMSPATSLMRASDLAVDRDTSYDCDLFGAFVRYTDLHVHRAVDPSFRLYYFTRTCPARAVWFHERSCVSSLLEGVGSEGQLAEALIEYRAVTSDRAAT